MEQLERSLRFKKMLNMLTLTLSAYLILVIFLMFSLDKSLRIYFWVLFWLLLLFLVLVTVLRPMLISLDIALDNKPPMHQIELSDQSDSVETKKIHDKKKEENERNNKIGDAAEKEPIKQKAE